jgi:hypothetical protein
MAWWHRFVPGVRPPAFPIDPARLPMPGWELVHQESATAVWRDATGDVISLTRSTMEPSMPTPDSHGDGLRSYCRGVAEDQGAGLVEAATVVGAEGPSIAYIYKRLDAPAITFFGVAATPVALDAWTWMVIAYERGVTGMREAVVTDRLLAAGQLTLESYEASWARDPYDPSYAGVDRRTLRYLSDAEEYDAEFPNHPLTKVRRELRRLLAIQLSPETTP